MKGLTCAAIWMVLATGAIAQPLVEESASKGITDARARCGGVSGCEVTGVEDHGKFWLVRFRMTDSLAGRMGGVGGAFKVDKRKDRITATLMDPELKMEPAPHS